MKQQIENVRIAIIVPAYNEEQRIFEVLNNIKRFLIHNSKFIILVVDDGSTDNTFDQALLAGVKVLKHIVNRGQGAALATGTKYALRHGADIVVHFDADGQHEPADIIKLAKPIINRQVEVVLGSRFLNTKTQKTRKHENTLVELLVTSYALLVTKEVPFLRRLLLAGSLVINSFTTGIVLSDAHNGLRALSANAAKKIIITQDRMAHATEYIQEIKRLDLSYQEIPVTIKYRQTNKKSQGFFEGVKILKELFLGKLTK